MKKYDIDKSATNLCNTIKVEQLNSFRERMPKDKQGIEININGITYIASVRRLTPMECDRLQTIPRWYNWSGISETQHLNLLGNGWNVDTIKHCWSFLPDFGRPIRVWSLFDGMACGHIVLNELNISIECYISSEIDKHAIKAEKQNFPDMIQVGSVTDIDVTELVEKYGVPDFIFGGSPCQSFSMSGKMNGMSTSQGEEIYTLKRYLELKSQGFEFDGQSYLFWEYMRILTELRKFNPNILFFLENVEMLNKWERCLSHAIGVRGVHINSALVSAQNRKRIYWSNIKVKDLGCDSIFDFSDDPFELPRYQTDIPQPDDKGIVIKDILLDCADSKYYLSDQTTSGLIDSVDSKKLKEYLLEPQFSQDDVVRYMERPGNFCCLSLLERFEFARVCYNLEKQRLHDRYYGMEMNMYDNQEITTKDL